MAKITPEEYLDMLREMTAEQALESARIAIQVIGGEQLIEYYKMMHNALTPKQRWEYTCWVTDQDRRTEETHFVTLTTFEDGTTAWRTTDAKRQIGTAPKS